SCRRAGCDFQSIDLEPDGADDRAPLVELALEERLRLRQRLRIEIEAERRHALLHLALLHDLVHGLIELAADVRIVPGGREDAGPGDRLEAGEALLGEGLHIGYRARALETGHR